MSIDRRDTLITKSSHGLLTDPDVRRLLVVDDDANNRSALVRRLTQRGYEVEVAEDGQHALDRIFSQNYNLILLDQMMPGMTGIELLRLLRGTYSESDLPVIMVTGIGHPQAVVEALRRGANDYLVKPATAEEVAARIEYQLDRAKTEREVKAKDPLTGLNNRASFLKHLAKTLTSQETGSAAVFTLGLDGFKAINDSLGPELGDQVLREVAARIKASLAEMGLLSSGGMVARSSGDEFVVFIGNIGEQHQPARIAESILERVSAPQLLGNLHVVVTASIGIAVVRERVVSAPEFLQEADLAMHHAKEAGRNRCKEFTQDMRERAQARMSVAIDLRSAVERGQLIAMYQPIVNLRDGSLAGFESLLRWRHPERGILRPAEFVPIAEDTGLIIPIGGWILDHAIRQLKQWQQQSPELMMNVNLSVKQLGDPKLIERVQAALEETGIRPQTLKLELTESVLMTDLDAAKPVLAGLEALKIGLELDDFGTGYSSLSYLRNLHFTSLKIDRSWVAKLTTDTETRAIVEMIIHLAHKLNMSVVAEGIEDVQQFGELASMGCDRGQGYYLSMPLTADEAERLIEETKAERKQNFVRGQTG